MNKYAAYQKKWREEHKEYLREYQRNRYLTQQDRIRARVKAYEEANQETILEKKRLYAQRPDIQAQRKEYLRKYNEENRDSHIQRVNLWRMENPEKFLQTRRKYVIARRARKRQAPGFYSSEAWLQKCAYYGWKCIYCENPLSEQTVTTDHRKPLSKGGSNWLANLAPACKSCNSRKQAKLEFRAAV